MLGPPGAGKGTQAQRIARHFGVPSISTGDLFRAAAADQDELGGNVRSYLQSGRLVPDDVTNAVVARRLAERDANYGFVLDGFPRTTHQAMTLDAMLTHANRDLDVVIALHADDDEIIRRLSGRRVCRSCGAPFHVEFNPPRRPGACDRCGGELYQRDDDNPATIDTRLKTYHAQTAEVLDFYAAGERLCEVDAVGPVDAVAGAVLSATAQVLAAAGVAIGPGWPWTGRNGWFVETPRLAVHS
jgi:adenylate kinase